MRIQTILNRVEKFKAFTYGKAQLVEHDGGPALVVQVVARKNSRPLLLRVPEAGPPLRSPGGASIRVRPVVGNPRLPGLSDASGRLQAVRCDGGTRPLG